MNVTWQNEDILSKLERLRTWCVYSDHGTFITELSHQGIKNKKEHLQLFFFCIYSCPQIPTFLTEKGTCMQTSSFSFH